MTYVLTLVAASPALPLSMETLQIVRAWLNEAQADPNAQPGFLTPQKAADISMNRAPGSVFFAKLRAYLDPLKTDYFLTSAAHRRKKLLLADMDATIVAGETLDEIAALAGIGKQVSEITRAAMEGEIDFPTALRRRVALLKGQPESLLQEVLQKTKLNPGAKTLVETMRRHGALCVLVSGGFSYFTSAVSQQAGFHHHHGNTLGIADGLLTGEVNDPILDKTAKAEFLKDYAIAQNISMEETLTLGDGANDLAMLQTAGLGIGYRSKEILLRNLNNHILHGDLTAGLYAQGYKEEEILVSVNHG